MLRIINNMLVRYISYSYFISIFTVTPIQSALAMKEYMPHADTMTIDDVAHFCWSDVFGGDIVAPGE